MERIPRTVPMLTSQHDQGNEFTGRNTEMTDAMLDIMFHNNNLEQCRGCRFMLGVERGYGGVVCRHSPGQKAAVIGRLGGECQYREVESDGR